MQSTLIYPAIMLSAGIGIPIMAALNSNLGLKLESTALATAIVFLVGLVISTIYLLQVDGMPGPVFRQGVPWYLYLGGSLVAFYVLSVTWVSPRFGVGNAISFVLLGQLIAISVIDQFGIFGANQVSLTLKRGIGLLLMVVGVFLVVKR